MRTMEELMEYPNLTDEGNMLRIHGDPIPNWYAYFRGIDCPFCDNQITWDWGKQKMPMITNEASTQHLVPSVTGAKLLNHGHRFLQVKCGACGNLIQVDNFDR